MRKLVLLLLLLTIADLLVSRISSAEVYKYVNKDGVVSYTDSLQSVPEKQRKKATVVPGLREKEEKSADKAKGPGGEPAPDEKQNIGEKIEKTIGPAKQQAVKVIQDAKDNEYLKPAAVVIAFIIVFFLIGKAANSLGYKTVGSILRVLVVVGLLAYFFCAYTQELSGRYTSVTSNINLVKGTIDKRHADGNRLQNEAAPEKKEQR